MRLGISFSVKYQTGWTYYPGIEHLYPGILLKVPGMDGDANFEQIIIK